MHVAIVGSRQFRNRRIVEQVVHRLIDKYGDDLVIVSGGAQGADWLAEDVAKFQNVPTEIYPAKWAEQGRSAGFNRNHTIVAAADIVIAFFAPGERTPGTQHTVATARKAGKTVHVYQDGHWTEG